MQLYVISISPDNQSNIYLILMQTTFPECVCVWVCVCVRKSEIICAHPVFCQIINCQDYAPYISE